MFIQMEMFKSIQAFLCERHAYLKQGQQKMATTSSARRSLGRQTTAAPSVRGRAGGRRRRPLPLSPSTTPSTPSPSSTTTRTGLLGLGGRLGRKSPLPAGVVLASGDEDTDDVVEFGYNRKDVLILCTLPLVGGYLTYYGLQKFAGLNPIEAGNYVQVIFVFVLCVAWCGSYLFRVGTKNMTYTQQLKDYEEAVMEKRLEEMSDTEIEEILNQGKTPQEIYKEDRERKTTGL